MGFLDLDPLKKTKDFRTYNIKSDFFPAELVTEKDITRISAPTVEREPISPSLEDFGTLLSLGLKVGFPLYGGLQTAKNVLVSSRLGERLTPESLLLANRNLMEIPEFKRFMTSRTVSGALRGGLGAGVEALSVAQPAFGITKPALKMGIQKIPKDILGSMAETGLDLGVLGIGVGLKESLKSPQLFSKAWNRISQSPKFQNAISAARGRGIPEVEIQGFVEKIRRDLWGKYIKKPYVQRLNIGLGRAGFAKIPYFKNTNEAIKYGQSIKGDIQQIELLKKEYEKIKELTKTLVGQVAMNNITKGQLIREAFEEAEKSLLSPKDLLAPKPIPTPIKAEKAPVIEDLKGETAPKTPIGEGGLAQPPDKIRAFIETVKGAEKTVPEVREIIDSRYTPITNKETITEAQLFVNTNLNESIQIAMSNELPTARSNAIAISLIDKFQQEGNFEQARQIVEKTAERNTKIGQAIQALAIYERLTPEGILRYADSVLRSARENISKDKLAKWEKLVGKLTSETSKEKLAKQLGIPYLSETLMKKLYDRAVKISSMMPGREKSIEIALLMKDISSEVPKDIWKKISLIQTMSMLLNPKTIIRNILGNSGFMVMENISDAVGTIIDASLSFITGERTQYLPSLKTQFVGLKKGWEEGLEEALLGIDLGKFGTKFDLPQNSVFDSGVLGGLEKTLSVVLRAPDRAAYQAAFNASISNQMKAKRVSEPTVEMIEFAHYEGLYRTFQDDSVLSRAFVGLKRALNVGQGFGVGDMVIKFPKTPANILSRGIEYSPLGFTRAIYEIGRALLGKGFDQQKFVKETARAMTGTTLLVGTGAILASLGIITPRREKEKKVAGFLREVGIGDYRINISALKRFIMSGMNTDSTKRRYGDIYATYDWFLPNSIGMAIGANFVTSKERESLIERVLDASNTLVEQPMLTGIKVATSEGIIEGMGRLIKDVPGTFVPTLLNQVRQLTDNITRNTKDPDYFKEVKNRIFYRIPGLSKTLPAQVGSFGETKETYKGGTNNPFNVFMNPSFVTKYAPSPEAKLVLDIWQSTGEDIHFPREAPKSVTIDGQKRILTPKEQKDFQSYIGNRTGVLYGILAKDQKFMTLPDDVKAKRLQGFLTDIFTAGKIEILGYKPKNVSKNIIGIIRELSNWWKVDAYRREKLQRLPTKIPSKKRGFLSLVP